MIPLHLFVGALVGWLRGEHRKSLSTSAKRTASLKAQLQNHRLRLSDDDRRRLAARGAPLGRRLLAQVATIVTPDTILRWHRQLIAQKWTHARRRPGRPNTLPEIRRLVVRMATENPTWGYTRIQGALKNLGHRVARSTIATILKQQGIPSSGGRSTSWQTFLRAHWGFLIHYHRERNHQGLGNDLIEGVGGEHRAGCVRRRQRLGGLLNYYYRAA